MKENKIPGEELAADDLDAVTGGAHDFDKGYYCPKCGIVFGHGQVASIRHGAHMAKHMIEDNGINNQSSDE